MYVCQTRAEGVAATNSGARCAEVEVGSCRPPVRCNVTRSIMCAEASGCRLFSALPADLESALSNEPTTANYHNYGITPEVRRRVLVLASRCVTSTFFAFPLRNRYRYRSCAFFCTALFFVSTGDQRERRAAHVLPRAVDESVDDGPHVRVGHRGARPTDAVLRCAVAPGGQQSQLASRVAPQRAQPDGSARLAVLRRLLRAGGCACHTVPFINTHLIIHISRIEPELLLCNSFDFAIHTSQGSQV